MSDRLPMSDRKICEASPNAISSPESESGVTPCASPDGQMTDLFGREVAPVRPSPARGKAEGLMTLATSGRLGIDSSPSATLQQSLENRLMTRLDSAGSTLFKLTWKGRRTPLGRRYLERAALALHTPGKDSILWVNAPGPTPTSPTESGGLALCKWGGANARKTMRRYLSKQEINGALNPDLPCWLMGLPIEFSNCADLAMQSFRKSHKRSSKRTWRQSDQSTGQT